eukprot:3901362-Pleurochrysis_carterae.AAC.3
MARARHIFRNVLTARTYDCILSTTTAMAHTASAEAASMPSTFKSSVSCSKHVLYLFQAGMCRCAGALARGHRNCHVDACGFSQSHFWQGFAQTFGANSQYQDKELDVGVVRVALICIRIATVCSEWLWKHYRSRYRLPQ